MIKILLLDANWALLEFKSFCQKCQKTQGHSEKGRGNQSINKVKKSVKYLSFSLHLSFCLQKKFYIFSLFLLFSLIFRGSSPSLFALLKSLLLGFDKYFVSLKPSQASECTIEEIADKKVFYQEIEKSEIKVFSGK